MTTSKAITTENQSEGLINCQLKNDLTLSERRLLLSGKMQRILDKACHGGARRFAQCNRLLDSLEERWAKEDSMV